MYALRKYWFRGHIHPQQAGQGAGEVQTWYLRVEEGQPGETPMKPEAGGGCWYQQNACSADQHEASPVAPPAETMCVWPWRSAMSHDCL